MQDYWYDEDDEDVRERADQELIDSLFFLLNTSGETGCFSRKDKDWAQEAFKTLWQRGVISIIKEEENNGNLG
jgi:hypothetical protein